MGGQRVLVLSDLHFGGGDDLLRSRRCLERIEPELEWATTLVLNGDTFELLTGRLDAAIRNARGFFSAVSRHIEKLVFIPGNHDHHFVAQATDRHRFARYLGIDDEVPFRLHMAEMLLEELTGGGCEIVAPYPLVEIEGVTFHHGHYISPHLPGKGIGARFFDRLTWRLAGLERGKGRELTGADYEALMGPLHELLYQAAQLPSSTETRRNGEKLLGFASKLLHTPGQLGRRAVGAVVPRARRSDAEHTNPGALFMLIKPEEAALAMADVCRNLGVSAGPVCFGHSHAPFTGMEKGGWMFHNSGSWILDHREMAFPGYAHLAWPGTALRLFDGGVERRDLLEDCTLQELMGMLNEGLPRGLAPFSRRRPRRSTHSAYRSGTDA